MPVLCQTTVSWSAQACLRFQSLLKLLPINALQRRRKQACALQKAFIMKIIKIFDYILIHN
jgi:hypothetical protein